MAAWRAIRTLWRTEYQANGFLFADSTREHAAELICRA